MHKETPPHLGGHLNKTHIDEGALDYLIEKFGIESMLDIGCGPGGMVDLAIERGLSPVCGIDGDPTVTHDNVVRWDYRKGAVRNYMPGRKGRMHSISYYDLAWSVEFVEHVDRQYVPHFMTDFTRCKYVAMTFAPPGTPGHHHVNCQPANYWIDTFADYGFEFDFDTTMEVRAASTMKKPFMQRNGLFFRKAA